ncbi:glycine betaine/proline transport system substrate-binding protein [Limimonas halophila]|uniref:Glycine betaine/proline transport system substrate-binding protein n=1 Tax=Limimonas halophila TaxID=1082479 RepID=A0A1G7RF59_9PROT|nr:glycine betaine ABC transporter substrate-binding protein [Limimonas halophila]SDG09391.1 glycine betaine/proline transport system substrate-binding protein [Limimonas halophila]
MAGIGARGLRTAALAGLLVLAGPGAAPAAPDQAASNRLRIGWTPWASSEATARLAATVLRERLGYSVELVQAGAPFLYRALAEGEVDVFLDSWQPDGHRSFLDAVGREVVDYGILYGGARLGWIVPERTTPAVIGAIPDLKDTDVRARLNGTIRGVDAGTGVMQLSRDALQAYGLDGYSLAPSSDAGAALAVRRALDNGEPAVVTARRPHWMFEAYALRFLADPKDALGGPQRVHKLVRTGFMTDHPWASRVLMRMHLPRAAVRRIMAEGRARTYPRAVDTYIRRNPARMRYWVTGRMTAREEP